MQGGRGTHPGLWLLWVSWPSTRSTPPRASLLQDIVDKFNYKASNPDLGNPATTKWVE